jgi:hypothetical protein
VGEAGDGARFTADAAVSFLAGEDGRTETLERYAPLETRIVAKEHLAHPAGAELFEDLVGSDRGTDHRRPPINYR